MKLLVSVKRVPDYETKVKIKADGSGIETAGLKWIINPFDEIAVQEAVFLKERGVATEIVVVSIGTEECSEQLRKALAMGGDRGILVSAAESVDSEIAARVSVALYQKEKPDFFIMGKQAIDSDASQTPALLAAKLKISQANFASKIEIEKGSAQGGHFATVTREVDGGLETVRIPSPGVISTDLRLNTPRHIALPQIMAAKKKSIETIPIATLGVDVTPVTRTRKIAPPPKRQGGRKVKDVAELLTVLRNEAGVL